jgi:hypothetical protein
MSSSENALNSLLPGLMTTLPRPRASSRSSRPSRSIGLAAPGARGKSAKREKIGINGSPDASLYWIKAPSRSNECSFDPKRVRKNSGAFEGSRKVFESASATGSSSGLKRAGSRPSSARPNLVIRVLPSRVIGDVDDVKDLREPGLDRLFDSGFHRDLGRTAALTAAAHFQEC